MYWKGEIFKVSPKQCSTLPTSGNVCMFSSFKKKIGNSLVVQWLGFSALNAVGWRSVPGLKTKVLKFHGAGKKKKSLEDFPVVQWLRLCLPMLGVRVWFLVMWLRSHMLPGQNMKQRQYCKKFNKDFKNSPHQKNPKKVKILVRVVTIGKDGHGAYSKQGRGEVLSPLTVLCFKIFCSL